VTLPAFTTRRLALVPATLDDLDAVWALWRQPEVRRYLFDDIPVTRERASDALRRGLGDGEIGIWIVRGQAEAVVIGTVGLLRTTIAVPHDADFLGSIEVLAAFAPHVWGRGYAIEALEPLVAHAFGTLALARLVAVADIPNEASDRMLRRLEFTATGECEGPVYRARTYVLNRRAACLRPPDRAD
jgi:RimJ/RimL family protein N-acetyltransferase